MQHSGQSRSLQQSAQSGIYQKSAGPQNKTWSVQPMNLSPCPKQPTNRRKQLVARHEQPSSKPCVKQLSLPSNEHCSAQPRRETQPTQPSTGQTSQKTLVAQFSTTKQWSAQPSQQQVSAQPSQHQFSAQPSQHQFSAQPSQNQFSAQPSQQQFSAQPSQQQLSAPPCCEVKLNMPRQDTLLSVTIRDTGKQEYHEQWLDKSHYALEQSAQPRLQVQPKQLYVYCTA